MCIALKMEMVYRAYGKVSQSASWTSPKLRNYGMDIVQTSMCMSASSHCILHPRGHRLKPAIALKRPCVEEERKLRRVIDPPACRQRESKVRHDKGICLEVG